MQSLAPNHRHERNHLPPGAPLPSAVQTFAFGHDPHGYLRWCRARYGSTFTVRPFTKPPLVFMSDAADIKAIVAAPADVLHPGQGGRVIVPLVGDSSFMLSEGDEHLAGRRSILPGFHHERVSAHTDMVRATVVREIASWPLDVPIALHPRLRALTLRVILQTVFGVGDERVDSLHTRLMAMYGVSASLALHMPALRHLPPWRQIWQQFLAERTSVDAIIAELIVERARSNAQDDGLLAMLLGPRHATDDRGIERVRDTIMSLILAGHETTAAELAWAVQLLGHNRGVTQRFVRDLDADGERGQYLDAIIREVLRHRGVFLFTIPRAVAKPIDIAGRTYRSPVHLVGCIHLMQHDAALYPEPEVFRPERFLDRAPSSDVWMPWGGGSRRCPGHRLAMVEMQTVLRTLFERLEVEPVGARVETARWRSVIVAPGGGCRVVLRQRRHS